MTPDLATYAEAINEAWNSHDVENVLRYYSPEYVGDDIGQASPVHGRDGMRAMLESCWRGFPDLRFKVIGTVAQGIRLVIVWVGEGTHQGPIMNIPPTWHKVEVRGVSVIEVENGLVVRGQYVWDLAGMLRHIGLLPEL